jgi:hypothetical protein
VSPSLIALETQDFVAASRMLRLWVAAPLQAATSTLLNALADKGGMAGSDQGGLAWATTYDRAAQAAVAASVDAVNSVDKLAAMFAQTARNYAAADQASTADSRRLADDALATLPRDAQLYFAPMCLTGSAAGASRGGPPGWHLVEHLVGYVWPNGHQGRLRAAAAAWRSSSVAVEHAAGNVLSAAQLAISDHLPEADDIWRVCDGLSSRLRSLAEVHQSIGASCEELAAHLDAVHSAVEGELISLIEWTAGIEAAGGVLSVVSFGLAEAPTQVVEGARVASAAARIAGAIERFIELSRLAAARIASAADRAAQVSARLRAVLDAKLTEAAVSAVGRFRTLRWADDTGALGLPGGGRFPQLSVTLGQLEAKFKHAADFGVLEPRGRPGFAAFRSAIDDFLRHPATRRIHGKYRGQEVILSFQPRTGLVVVQSRAGEFVSGWRMTKKQLGHVLSKGVLGGE